MDAYFRRQKERIDEILFAQIDRLDTADRLKEAMHYSVQAGGKRIRPILLLATMEAFGKNSQSGLPVASAIELIHTYSLIHDDLPAMDDDDLRRGKPTNHKIYGEATAILAGDALLTLSFEAVAEIGDADIDGSKKTQLIAMMARAAGAEGMVGGQCFDLEAERKKLTFEELEQVHLRKTGKLLAFSIEAGALLADADEFQTNQLRNFAQHLGLAFQIRDDILDIIGDTNTMGKTAGSDLNKQKSTYPQLLSLDGAKRKLEEHFIQAKHHLSEAAVDHRRLSALSDYIVNRDV
ncbi:MAG TPA: farnesyl diphosphate synthase [Bacillales bacterium]|nr:farnesyl diphosphate synthase [Bacillales bacterium]